MSNYALQSELNQLERELRQVQQYNSELRGELSTVANGVDRAHRDLEDYNTKIRNTLDNCNGSMHSSHQRVVDATKAKKEGGSKWQSEEPREKAASASVRMAAVHMAVFPGRQGRNNRPVRAVIGGQQAS